MRIPAWFQRWASEGNDPAIRATGYTYSTDRFYDEQKAVAGYAKSRRQTETGRPYQLLPTRNGVVIDMKRRQQ